MDLELAIQDYLAKREQMGARKAAAHVIQTHGVTTSELSQALAERGLLLKQRPARSRIGQGIADITEPVEAAV